MLTRFLNPKNDLTFKHLQAYQALNDYNFSEEEMNYYDYLERNEDVYRTSS